MSSCERNRPKYKMGEKYPGSFSWAMFFMYSSNIVHLSWLCCATATRTGPRLQHCWSGGTDDDPSVLMNLSCSTGVEALGNVFSLSDKSRLGGVENEDANLTLPLRGYYCIAFMYYTTDEVTDRVTAKSLTAEYTCDMLDACKGRTMLKGYVYQSKGRNGDLFCCDSEDNCNNHALINSPLQQRTCYHGIRDDKTTTIEMKTCQLQNTPCMTKVTKVQGDRDGPLVVVREEYSCDNYRTCDAHKLTGLPGRDCKASANLTDYSETELCCCSSSNCLVPPWLDDPSPHSTSDLPDQNTWQKTVLISLLVAISFLGVTISFCVVLRVRRRRKSANEENSAHFTRHAYTSVTVDGTDNTADNVQIIQS